MHYDCELYHYGVPGMKWGVRHDYVPVGRSPSNSVSDVREPTPSINSKLTSKKKIQNRVDKGSDISSQIMNSNGGQKHKNRKMPAKQSDDKLQDGRPNRHKLTDKQKKIIVAGAAIAATGLAAYGYYRIKRINGDKYKRDVDQILNTGTILNTLSYDENRTKNTDMFFATFRKLDNHQYNALFNKSVSTAISAANDNPHGLKKRIKNKVLDQVKVASEKSSSNEFKKLFDTDSDFKDFVMNKDRMESHFDRTRLKFKGYREALNALEKIRTEEKPSSKDLETVYRMFNYVIPSDGQGNAEKASDILKQRNKFFKALKESGYGALLDTNDSLYGGFHASSPVIVFDQSKIVLDSVEQTTLKSKRFSELALAGRKLLGV